MCDRSPASARCSSARPVRSEAPAAAPSPPPDPPWASGRSSPETEMGVKRKIGNGLKHSWRNQNRAAKAPARLPHLYDLSDFTLHLQLVQLDDSCADGLVAPKETSGGRHHIRHVVSPRGSDPLSRMSKLDLSAVGSSATHPLCSSSSLRPRDVTTRLKPRWFRLIDSVKLWLNSSGKKRKKPNEDQH